MNWLDFKTNDIIDKIPDEKMVGFIYLMIFEGKKYIGKKSFYRFIGKGKKRVKKESYWRNYKSSNDVLKKQDKDDLQRFIMDYAYTHKELSYLELHYQIKYDVLISEDYFNSNILGKYFYKDGKIY